LDAIDYPLRAAGDGIASGFRRRFIHHGVRFLRGIGHGIPFSLFPAPECGKIVFLPQEREGTPPFSGKKTFPAKVNYTMRVT
jgi:hypothetical protein